MARHQQSLTQERRRRYTDRAVLPSAGFTGAEPREECWRQLDQELGNRLFETLDDLRDAALFALNRIKAPDVFTYLCP